jgi:hypothetical protein
MTSGNTFPRRLTEIDDLARPDHWYLRPEDDCYFLGEYTARKGFVFSVTNQLVLNFKKSMDKRCTPQWWYKDRAIDEVAAAFRTAWLNMATLVPIPPSKAKSDSLYDDRVVRMLQSIRVQPRLDVRKATVGFEKLGEATGTQPKSLIRMFGPRGDPQARNLFGIICYLQKQAGVELHVRQGPG